MNNFWWWVRFDRRISGVGSNCSANWATTKSPSMTCFSSRASNYGILAIKPIVMNVYRFKTKRLTLKRGKTQNTPKHQSPSWIFFTEFGSSSAKTSSMERNSSHWLERSTQVSSNWFFLMGLQVGSCYNWTQELLFSQRKSYAIRSFETHCSPLTQNSIIEQVSTNTGPRSAAWFLK